MNKMNKVVLLLVVVAIASALFITPVLAASPADTEFEGQSGTRIIKGFTFGFRPPFGGSIQTTTQSNEIEASGPAFVQQTWYYPELASYGANYYCFNTNSSVTDVATTIVTLYDDSSLHTMPYKTGYGLVGDSYHLAGYPNTYNFTYYYVEGSWDSSTQNSN